AAARRPTRQVERASDNVSRPRRMGGKGVNRLDGPTILQVGKESTDSRSERHDDAERDLPDEVFGIEPDPALQVIARSLRCQIEGNALPAMPTGEEGGLRHRRRARLYAGAFF